MSGVEVFPPAVTATTVPASKNNNRNRNKMLLYGFWRILFATVAILDLSSCWSTMIVLSGSSTGTGVAIGVGRGERVDRGSKEGRGITKRQRRKRTGSSTVHTIKEEETIPIELTCENNDGHSSSSAASWSSYSNILFGGGNSPPSNSNSSNGTCSNEKTVKKENIKRKKKRNKRNKGQQQSQSSSSLSLSSSPLFSPLFSSPSFSIMIHLLLGVLCLLEMIIRSIETKRIVFENEAINKFEERFAGTIARVYSRRKLALQGRQRQKHKGVSGFFKNATTRNSNTARMTRMIKTTTTRTSFKLNPYLSSFSSSTAAAIAATSDKTTTTTTTTTTAAASSTTTAVVSETATATIHRDDDQDLLLEVEDKNDDHDHDHDSVNAITSNDDNDQAILSDDEHDGHDPDEHEYVNFDDDDEGFEEEEEEKEEKEEQQGAGADINKEDDAEDEAKNKKNIILFLRSTFRLYLPVGITCIFWLSLLPFKDYYNHLMTFQNHHHHVPLDGCINSDEDTALATIWIATFIKNWNETIIEIHDIIVETAWEQIIWQYNAIFQPKLFWNRVQNVLNVVKWVRFAFPLFRMMLKLNDQIMLISSVYRRMKSSDEQRERRIKRPSLMLRDLKRIERFHKVETTIAGWPSQCSMLLDMAKETLGGGGGGGGGGGDGDGSGSGSGSGSGDVDDAVNNSIAEQFLERSRIRGKKITLTIKKLQRQLRRSVTEFTSSEVYDNIVRLSRDISCRHIIVEEDDVAKDNDHDNSNTSGSDLNSPRNYRRHHLRSSDNSTSWYDYLHLGSLLGSRDYLISPRSRFSVVVRITVTNCLLLELTRLFVSWHLTQTFHLSITQVISRLFIDCNTNPDETKRHFKFVTDQIDNWHTILAHAVPFVPFPKEKLLILCVPTSQLSKLFLQLGFMLETFIDVVSFLDIFFWFFTGDLDGETGLVIPKPFFGRCILPGTLVQVLDHPTLPKVLPFYINRIVDTTISIGWSRVIRWVLAIVPAFNMIVFQPLAAYFFRHFEDSNATGDEDILMSYAESFGYLPQRASMMALPSTIHHSAQTTIADTGSPNSSPVRMALKMGALYTNDNKSNLDNHEAVQIPHIDSMGFYTQDTIANNNNDNLEEHPSTVRFANNVSVLYNDEDDDDDGRHNDSLRGFDIGLSLSSHALDDL